MIDYMEDEHHTRATTIDHQRLLRNGPSYNKNASNAMDLVLGEYAGNSECYHQFPPMPVFHGFVHTKKMLRINSTRI